MVVEQTPATGPKVTVRYRGGVFAGSIYENRQITVVSRSREIYGGSTSDRTDTISASVDERAASFSGSRSITYVITRSGSASTTCIASMTLRGSRPP